MVILGCFAKTDFGFFFLCQWQWHLGFFTDAYLPMNRGFESHFGYYTGHEDYFDHESNDDQVY